MGLAAFNRMRREKAKNEEKRKSEAGRQEGQKVEAEQKALNDMTVPELKELAQKQEIEGYSNMKKDDLVQALEQVNADETGQD